MMGGGWRRDPAGKGIEYLNTKREGLTNARYNQNIWAMSEEEFIEAMRAERASEDMINRELITFRAIKLKQEEAKNTDRRRRLTVQVREEELPESLAKFSNMENKRKAKRRKHD